MRLKIHSTLAILSLWSPLVAAGSGWTGYINVSELVPTSRHYYEFRLALTENPSGCKNAQWFYQDYSSFGAEEMFITLLEALKSRLKVRVYVSGKCNLNGYSEISSVSIVQ